MKTYIEDQHFISNSWGDDFEVGDYDNCVFSKSTFGGVDLAGCIFVDCTFDDCDFTNAKVANAAFRNVTFKNCKLLGVRFDYCNTMLLAMRFEACLLNLASFYELPLKKTIFVDCQLLETDFEAANLQEAVFDNCDCQGAIFRDTDLTKADLSTAYNYTINPTENTIKKAKFSTSGLAGLLHQYDIKVVK